MLTIRRPIIVGGVVMLAAVFTCAFVFGEPANPAKVAKADEKAPEAKAPAKDDGFTADTETTSPFADKPLLVFQGKDGHRLFALQVQPALPPAKAKPRDLVILVDTTASQAGGHFLAAEKLVEAVIAKLGKDDRVSLRTVNITSRDLTHGFKLGGDLAAGVKALNDELPMGAADLKTALKEAVKSFKGGDDVQRAIVYLGDGMSIRNPLNPSDVPDLAADMVQDHITFFHVPIGPRLDPTTLHGLACRTGGAPIRLTLKSEMNSVAQTLLDTVSAPVLHGASIELPEAIAYYLPNKLPPLRGDAPTLLVGEIKATDTLAYTLKGTVDGQEVTLNKVELKVPAADRDNFFLASMVQQWQAAKDQPALILRRSRPGFCPPADSTGQCRPGRAGQAGAVGEPLCHRGRVVRPGARPRSDGRRRQGLCRTRRSVARRQNHQGTAAREGHSQTQEGRRQGRRQSPGPRPRLLPGRRGTGPR